MGTSTRNPGQKGASPLVPSWLQSESSDGKEETPSSTTTSIRTSIGSPDRFSNARRNFTGYINSGGRDGRRLRRAISDYVSRSMGGAKNATQRLGSARRSTAVLLSVAGDVARSGASATAEKFFGNSLLGATSDRFFIELTQFVCPDGGTVDEGIGRSSYIDAIAESPELRDIPVENLAADEILVVVKSYMTEVIMNRIFNDVGNKVFQLPENVDSVNLIEAQIRDYVRGGVSDSFINSHIEVENLSNRDTQNITDGIYEQAYSILLSRGDEV